LTLAEVLQEHDFTQGLAEPQIAELAALANEVTFGEDEVILADGHRSQFFYLVLSGSVTVELCTPRLAVSVQALGPGEAFGWPALLGHQETLFRVRAREKTTVLRFAGADLVQVFRSDPALGTELMLRTLAVVAHRIEATEARFAEMCGIRIRSWRRDVVR
jgi:CRP-like cAMP-binding protein